jgi:lipopolysaccharide export LptBFGC system permease protein LptF
MAKLLLMSVLFATTIVPILAARDPRPKRGLTRAVRGILIFNVFYLLGVIFIYPRISG